MKLFKRKVIIPKQCHICNEIKSDTDLVHGKSIPTQLRKHISKTIEFDDTHYICFPDLNQFRQAYLDDLTDMEQQLTTLLRPGVNIWFEPLNHK